MRPILLLPGPTHTCPGHWLSLWEAELPGARRPELPHGNRPHRAAWVEALDEAIGACGGDAPLLVAHDLGCLAVVHWAARHHRAIHGALLVAPVDAEAEDAPEGACGFAPVPRAALPFPCRVVASSGDPRCSLERARGFARDWGAAFTDAGPKGHLDAAAGFGAWPKGEALLRELM